MADFNLQQAVATAIATATPIIIMMWNNRRTARKEVEAKHAENQAKQNEIATLLRFHPPHTHLEKSGVLHAEGISKPPED
jgi:hypothetical protein